MFANLRMKPSSITKSGFTSQWLWNTDMHMYAKCDQNIRCIVQELRKFSLTANGRMDRWIMDRHTDSQSDYSADPRDVQY